MHEQRQQTLQSARGLNAWYEESYILHEYLGV
jgi:hypothetical protein